MRTVALLATGLSLAAGVGRGPVALVVFTGTHSRLLLSKDGRTWRDATPSPRPFAVDDVQFLDARRGFATVGDCIAARESLYGTANGGRTWRRIAAMPTHSCHGGATTSISFVSVRRGWSTLVEPTASFATLSRTTDGGRSWRLIRGDLPLSGVVRFRTAGEGWLTSTNSVPASLYETRDGGRTFQPRKVPRPPRTRGPAVYEKPIFFGRRGVLATRWVRAAGGPPLDAFYRTSNGGGTWALASTLRLRAAADLEAVSARAWWVASRDAVYLTTSAGERWRRHALHIGFRPLQVSLTPVDARTAVLRTYNEPNRIRWFLTHDGGASFKPFRP